MKNLAHGSKCAIRTFVLAFVPGIDLRQKRDDAKQQIIVPGQRFERP
jgi:hypothetical protein